MSEPQGDYRVRINNRTALNVLSEAEADIIISRGRPVKITFDNVTLHTALWPGMQHVTIVQVDENGEETVYEWFKDRSGIIL